MNAEYITSRKNPLMTRIRRLTASDVVRHALVQRIIAAYETAEHSAKNGLPGQKKVYRRKP